MLREPPYRELHRPQFHFTAVRNWLNDPNGLVYFGGEYHLFFQHNARGLRWGPNSWGHAVSPDLVHWRQLRHAIEPDSYGWIWSGSAVVDRGNSARFSSAARPALVAVYSKGEAGKFGFPDTPVVQCISFSTDRGRSWSDYDGNPVLRHLRAENRDPRVIWHAPSGRWVMAFFLDGNDYALFGSADLTSWEQLCAVRLEGTGECPDFFPLPVDGDPERAKWVFWGGAGIYTVGRFDGRTYTAETSPLRSERGSNGYAAQTWSDIPPEDGRRIQISWMAGGRYPSMPFNQQMSFPVELTLRDTPGGPRLCRAPIREISLLNDMLHAWRDETLPAGRGLTPPTAHDLFRIQADVEPSGARALVLVLRGNALRFDFASCTFTFLGRDVPCEGGGERVQFEILLDGTSVELFVEEGRTSASFCFLPEAWDVPLELSAEGGDVRLHSLLIRELSSAWTQG